MTFSLNDKATETPTRFSIPLSYQGHQYRVDCSLPGQEYWYCDDTLIAVKRFNLRRVSEVEHNGIRLRLDVIRMRHREFSLMVIDRGETVAEQRFTIDVDSKNIDQLTKNEEPALWVKCSLISASIVILTLATLSFDARTTVVVIGLLSLTGVFLMPRIESYGIPIWPYLMYPGYLAGFSFGYWETTRESSWLWLAATAMVFLFSITIYRSITKQRIQLSSRMIELEE